MRRLRPEGVCIGGLKALAWLELLLGAALALAGCATPSANEAYGAAVRIEAERAERESGNIPLAVAHQAASNEPTKGSSASASRGQVTAFLSGLLGAPPQPSSAEEDALIARAIAEHEMRKP